MLLFALGVIVTGIITYSAQRSRSGMAIRQQTEGLATLVADETISSIREYPAYSWLLSYWHTNADELDIEYDVEYGKGTETEEKCRLLSEHCPDLEIKYATMEELNALNPEDQKLYAEITYSWLTTRLNHVKQIYDMDFLFCVVADETYQGQFFLLSAADPGAVRGTTYKEVYPLGHEVTVSEDQELAMRKARANNSYLADAGEFMDYYVYLGDVNGLPAFLGMTYNLSAMRESENALSKQETAFAMLQEVILACICLLLIYFFVLRPLKKVQGNIHLYGKTKDSAKVRENLNEVRSHNEIGDLSNDIVELTTEMDNYISEMKTVTAERERASVEMSLAAGIQSGMLPHDFPPFPERSEFDIFASMDPAREVGGDFYNFFMVDDDHLAIVIADVSGKGVPAALFMMAASIYLQNSAAQGVTPAEILKKTNNYICSNNAADMFVTVWMGIMEISTGRLKAANAGHEYPAIQPVAGGDFELLKDKHSFVIGGMSDQEYHEYEIQLSQGTKIFLYTDGVPEATDSEEKMFGTDRMIDALNVDPNASPEQILKNVTAAVDDFVKDAEQFDDVTMLCLEYKGK